LNEYGLNYLKQQATLPIVADYLKFAQDSKYLIARERCEFISRILNNNVAATRNNSKVDYDVTKLGTRQQQTRKHPTIPAATPKLFSSTSPSPCPPPTQKQVVSSTKTTSPSSLANKNISRSRSSSAEHSQSPPLKKQANNKLMKKQQQPQLSETPTKKAAPTSNLRSTPILKRLRAMPNGRNAITSSSSSTSSSQPVLTATKPKHKQTNSVKKHGHSSRDEENGDGTPVLHM